MIVAPWGVWSCSDHRLIPFDRQGDPTDTSIKHITIRCADGEVLITYAGLGAIKDDLHLSEWLRRLLRNENWSLDQIIQRISYWSTKRYGPPLAAHNRPHSFLVGGFSHGHPRAVEITNIRRSDWSVRNHFTVEKLEVPELLISGKGQRAITSEDWTLLHKMTHRRPKRRKAYMRVLAAVHRRAKLTGLSESETISQGCITTSMPPDYGTPETGDLEQLFHWSTPNAGPGKSLPHVPILGKGLDYTAVFEASHLIAPYLEAGEQPSQEALDRWSDAIRRGLVAPPET
jgi:hypothetical protein